MSSYGTFYKKVIPYNYKMIDDRDLEQENKSEKKGAREKILVVDSSSYKMSDDCDVEQEKKSEKKSESERQREMERKRESKVYPF